MLLWSLVALPLLAGGLTALAGRRADRVAAPLGVVVAVGLARLALGEPPSRVLAGWLLGLGWLAVAVRVFGHRGRLDLRVPPRAGPDGPRPAADRPVRRVVVLAVTSPVRWIEHLMRDDGAPSTAVADDPDLTYVERVSLRIAAVGWIAAALAMIVVVVGGDAGTTADAWGLVVLAGSVVAVVAAAFSGRFRSLTRIT